MSEKPADEKPAEDLLAKEWLAETFPEPEPWPEPRPAAPEQQQPHVVQNKHSRLGDGLRGAAALGAGLYVYDALTDDDSGATDVGGDFSGS